MGECIDIQGYRHIHVHINIIVLYCLQSRERGCRRNRLSWHLGLNFCRTWKKGVFHINLQAVLEQGHYEEQSPASFPLGIREARDRGATSSTHLVAESRRVRKTENGAHPPKRLTPHPQDNSVSSLRGWTCRTTVTFSSPLHYCSGVGTWTWETHSSHGAVLPN